MAELTLSRPAARFVAHIEAERIAAVTQAFGLDLPRPINRATGSPDGRCALKLGPDEWVLLAPGEAAAVLEPALQPLVASLVDVSDRQLGFDLSGAGIEHVLNAFVPLDLGLRAFPVGMATRTIFEKAEIVLWRVKDDSFHIEVWRSFAPYLQSLLELSLAELA